MDNSHRNFSLMLEALAELQPEIEAAHQPSPWPLPLPWRICSPSSAPCPREALLLGLASDGLPVLLNLHDPHPGPLLVAADPGAGKTALLQMIAQAATEMHTPGDVQFGVVTNYPDEWGHLAESGALCGHLPHLSQLGYGFPAFALRLGTCQQGQQAVHPAAGR